MGVGVVGRGPDPGVGVVAISAVSLIREIIEETNRKSETLILKILLYVYVVDTSLSLPLSQKRFSVSESHVYSSQFYVSI